MGYVADRGVGQTWAHCPCGAVASNIAAMTMLIDIRAFLSSAREGSFSGAARALGVAPSVVTKRVGRLEYEIGAKLFVRTTRSLTLTPDGERLRPRLQFLVGELDETLAAPHGGGKGLSGQLRIKSPTTLGTLFVGQAIARFQALHPRISTELLLIDRSVNPLEEGLDMALGAMPQSYASVHETPLCPYPRLLVASPSYLEHQGTPATPNDIPRHECVAFMANGLTWSFQRQGGTISIDLHSRFTVNDSRVILDAAEQGLGLAVVPAFLAHDAIAAGRLKHVMPDYPIAPFELKAMVPRNKAHRPEVKALLEHLKREFDPPPWKRGTCDRAPA